MEAYLKTEEKINKNRENDLVYIKLTNYNRVYMRGSILYVLFKQRQKIKSQQNDSTSCLGGKNSDHIYFLLNVFPPKVSIMSKHQFNLIYFAHRLESMVSPLHVIITKAYK